MTMILTALQGANSTERIVASARFDKALLTWVPRRFFIGVGFPGFNSPANNRSGYATPEAALAASLRYERKGIASRA